MHTITPDTPLKAKAVEQGVRTLEEYLLWFNGYTSGYEERQKEVMSQISEVKEDIKNLGEK